MSIESSVAGSISSIKGRLLRGYRQGSLPGYLSVAIVLLAAAVGCANSKQMPASGETAQPYLEQDLAQITFPGYVTDGVRDAYEYALLNPDKLRYIPCYCGCGLTVGHKNNLDCYIAGVDGSGRVAFTNHAVRCDICVEITRDVKRLGAEGKSLKEVRPTWTGRTARRAPPLIHLCRLHRTFQHLVAPISVR